MHSERSLTFIIIVVSCIDDFCMHLCYRSRYHLSIIWVNLENIFMRHCYFCKKTTHRHFISNAQNSVNINAQLSMQNYDLSFTFQIVRLTGTRKKSFHFHYRLNRIFFALASLKKSQNNNNNHKKRIHKIYMVRFAEFYKNEGFSAFVEERRR